MSVDHTDVKITSAREESNHFSLEFKLFRGISLLLWFASTIVYTIAYSKNLKSLLGKIFLGAEGSLYDVYSVLYASGSATSGFGYEIYPLLSMVIANFILAFSNCDKTHKLEAGFLLIRTALLLIVTQLYYWNFTRLKSYRENFSAASKYMSKHALIFTVTAIFIVAPGLRAVYEGSTGGCSYNVSSCNVILMSEPNFTKTDFCAEDYIQYIVGREQLRICRDFILIHIGSYAIYNQSMFAIEWKWSDNKFHYVVRLLVLLLLLILSISVAIANVVPFSYPKEINLIFNMIEFIIFVIGLLVLSLNLSYIQFKITEPYEMSTTPNITSFV